jgi:hypothetical protein
MKLDKGDLLINSGEGTGAGTIERYEGKREPAAIRKRLSRERAGGDRWAFAWIELADMADGSGFPVYGKLGTDLEEVLDMRAIDPARIRTNPAAQLRAGKPNPASAANGRRGGRPTSS